MHDHEFPGRQPRCSIGSAHRPESFSPRIERRRERTVADEVHLVGENEELAGIAGPVLEVGRCSDRGDPPNLRVGGAGLDRKSATGAETDQIQRINLGGRSQMSDRAVEIAQPTGQRKVTLALTDAAACVGERRPSVLGRNTVGELRKARHRVDASTGLGREAVSDDDTGSTSLVAIGRLGQVRGEFETVDGETTIHVDFDPATRRGGSRGCGPPRGCRARTRARTGSRRVR